MQKNPQLYDSPLRIFLKAQWTELQDMVNMPRNDKWELRKSAAIHSKVTLVTKRIQMLGIYKCVEEEVTHNGLGAWFEFSMRNIPLTFNAKHS